MAMIHAYFDESGKHKDHPVVSLGGVCISQSNLDQFDEAWKMLLRQYGLHALHMKKVMKQAKLSPLVPARSSAERVEAMKPFADCINTKLEYCFAQAWDVEGFKSLSKHARAGLGSVDDPYHIAFARAITELGEYVHPEDKISVVCDLDRETAWDSFRHYSGIRAADPKLRQQTVSLSFADDEYFPALQAADMIAYLLRLEAKWQFYGIRYSYKPLLEYLIDKRPKSSTAKWGVMLADKKTLIELGKGLDKLPLAKKTK